MLRRYCSFFGTSQPTHLYTTNPNDSYLAENPNPGGCAGDETRDWFHDTVYVATIDIPPYMDYLVEMKNPNSARFVYSVNETNYLKSNYFSEVRVVGYLPKIFNVNGKNMAQRRHFVQIKQGLEDDCFADSTEVTQSGPGYFYDRVNHNYMDNGDVIFFNSQSSPDTCSLAVGK